MKRQQSDEKQAQKCERAKCENEVKQKLEINKMSDVSEKKEDMTAVRRQRQKMVHQAVCYLCGLSLVRHLLKLRIVLIVGVCAARAMK